MVGISLLVSLSLAPAAAPPGLLVQAPRVEERRQDAVLVWNGIALEAIREARTPPPVAARHLAMLHVAIVDSVNTIYQTHKSFKVHLRATEPIDPEVAVAAAAQRILADLYPKQRQRFDKALDATLAAAPVGTSRSRGLTLGRYVADRVLAWRRNDGAEKSATHHVELAAGVWRPTPPGMAAGVLPAWGEVAPFGIDKTKGIRATPPPSIRSKEFARDLAEVRRVGNKRSISRTAEQTIIAWFWADELGTCTPPGHWNLIAQEAAQSRKTTLPENARLFALLNVALADASIVCWECKYRHKLWRPVTAIRSADEVDDKEQPDRDWLPLLPTPAFPSYVSGHSTFSGAAAGILEGFFGTDEIAFTVGSDGYDGMKREFTGFWQAAQEAGRSRIYGGIHYECDNREGLAVGKTIASEILRTRLLPDDHPTRQPRTGSAAYLRRERP